MSLAADAPSRAACQATQETEGAEIPEAISQAVPLIQNAVAVQNDTGHPDLKVQVFGGLPSSLGENEPKAENTAVFSSAGVLPR